MSLDKPYTPQKDSLPEQVCGFFTNNPLEELTLEDITAKFCCSRGNIHTQLRLAYENGLLVRTQNADGEYIYRAGRNLPRTPSPGLDMDRAHATHQAAVKAKSGQAAKPPSVPLPALDDIVIEDGIPIPTSRHVPPPDYSLKLRQLKPSQSFALPIKAQNQLKKNITVLHKAWPAKFTTKSDPATQTIRVWRVA